MLARGQTIAKINELQGHSNDHLIAYPNQIQGQGRYVRAPEDALLELQKGQELHHKVIIQNLEPCYRNLNQEDANELTRFIQEDLGYAVGNNARNLIPMNKEDHTGGQNSIHSYAVKIGAQIPPGTFRTGNYKDTAIGEMMESAGDANLEHKKLCAATFIREMQPRLDAYTNDVLSARDFSDEVNKGNVFEAIMSLPDKNQRVADLVGGLEALDLVFKRLRS
tara:strand:+ start:99 stop:764 length:666 start_codon:yes stop_codon:yes gene_type:complete